jgi:hypothetical protein
MKRKKRGGRTHVLLVAVEEAPYDIIPMKERAARVVHQWIGSARDWEFPEPPES